MSKIYLIFYITQFLTAEILKLYFQIQNHQFFYLLSWMINICSLSISALQPDSFFSTMGLLWWFIFWKPHNSVANLWWKQMLLLFKKWIWKWNWILWFRKVHILLRMNITVTLKKNNCFELNTNMIVKLSKVQWHFMIH